jgi:hypothetical protein
MHLPDISTLIAIILTYVEGIGTQYCCG